MSEHKECGCRVNIDADGLSEPGKIKLLVKIDYCPTHLMAFELAEALREVVTSFDRSNAELGRAGLLITSSEPIYVAKARFLLSKLAEKGKP